MDRLAKALHGKRLVVKVGSALLVEPGGMVREAWLDGLAHDIAGLRTRGQQVVVVDPLGEEPVRHPQQIRLAAADHVLGLDVLAALRPAEARPAARRLLEGGSGQGRAVEAGPVEPSPGDYAALREVISLEDAESLKPKEP